MSLLEPFPEWNHQNLGIAVAFEEAFHAAAYVYHHLPSGYGCRGHRLEIKDTRDLPDLILNSSFPGCR